MPTATATPNRVRGMVAVGRNSGIKPLGFVVWFSVPDADIKSRRLKQHWLTAGLDPAPLPDDPKAVNAFRRAVREQEGIRRHEQDRTITETDVREVESTADEVVYQVSRVVRDLSDQVVNYPKALRVIFVKATEEIKFQPLKDVPRAEVMDIMHAIQDAYDAATKAVPGSKVRTLVRHYLKDEPDQRDKMFGLSAENLRGKAGGVYFVLAKHERQLERLANFLHDLYKPEGRAYLHMIPLADGASERELIRRHFVDGAVDEAKSAIFEVAEMLRESRDVLGRTVATDGKARKREVRENVTKYHWRKLDRLKARVAEYNAALGEEQADVQQMLDMMHKQLRKLPLI